jgi:hypothetical protein
MQLAMIGQVGRDVLRRIEIAVFADDRTQLLQEFLARLHASIVALACGGGKRVIP